MTRALPTVTIAAEKVCTNLILLIDSSLNFNISFAENIWSVTRCCKLAVSLFAVPQVPLQDDLAWLAAKKFQTQSAEKSFLR